MSLDWNSLVYSFCPTVFAVSMNRIQRMNYANKNSIFSHEIYQPPPHSKMNHFPLTFAFNQIKYVYMHLYINYHSIMDVQQMSTKGLMHTK